MHMAALARPLNYCALVLCSLCPTGSAFDWRRLWCNSLLITPMDSRPASLPYSRHDVLSA